MKKIIGLFVVGMCIVALGGCAQKNQTNTIEPKSSSNNINVNTVQPQASPTNDNNKDSTTSQAAIAEAEFIINDVNNVKCFQPKATLIERCKETGKNNEISEHGTESDFRIGCFPTNKTTDAGKKCVEANDCEGYCITGGICSSYARYTLYLPHYSDIVTLHLCQNNKK